MGGESQEFGFQGEQDAVDEAIRRGYLIMDRNYRTPYGELDLILLSPQNEIVFVEVKSRTGTAYGYPETAVDKRKREHVLRSARYFLQQRYPCQDEVPWRVDIIAIVYAKNRKSIRDFKWYENITADE